MKRILLFFSALLATGPVLSQDDAVMKLGQQTYQLCVACHGPDGKGIKAGDLSMAPSLHGSKYLKLEDNTLATGIVLKGIAKEDNKYVQAMLPLEAALNDEQIAAVIAYVTKEFAGKRQKVSPASVAKARKTFADQKSPWKRSDLEDMLKAEQEPKLLSNVTYSIYEGKWEELPDFSQLTPIKTGKLENNLISLEPAKDIKGGFGMVFEGNLSLPDTHEYILSITSDDGSAFVVDGETRVGNDGIHPASTQRIKNKLEAGEHTFKILYFDGGGQRFLSSYVRGKQGTIWISEVRSEGKAKSKSYDPIPLTARNPGEAIVHRAFLPDAKPRSIGVGYPDKVSAVWDADNLNLAYVYRGEFMDASPNWNARGSGSNPLGKDRVKTAQGMPLQVLESLDEPWQPISETKVKYERDTLDPQKEITINVKHPDYQFRGYRLDKNRFPTFKYDFKKLTVTDRMNPEEIEGVTSLVRTIEFEGKADENLYLRLADTGSQETKDGWIDIGQKMKIKIQGADPVTRQIEGKKETLVPVSGESSITVTYRWNAPLES
ncbi:MAG: hypothetical protein CMO55_13980 [Verrucomicrobiales bacterium]|nr:hypothetical protein [Verrucomicrobiales bacterium]